MAARPAETAADQGQPEEPQETRTAAEAKHRVRLAKAECEARKQAKRRAAEEALPVAQAKRRDREESHRLVRAAARARAEQLEPPPTAGMTAKDAAKFRRAFQTALLTPDAASCGLAAAARAVKQLPPLQKRSAWQALTRQWQAHGFARDQYVVGSLPKKSTSIVYPSVAIRVMVAQCGGRGSFETGLLKGELEEVRDPETGNLYYRWSDTGAAGGAPSGSLQAPDDKAAGAAAAPAARREVTGSEARSSQGTQPRAASAEQPGS